MANILLFGGTDTFGVPDVVQSWIQQYTQQDNINFIVGDKNGVDTSFHKVLAASGATSKSLIYCMDVPKNNKYELSIKRFGTSYDSENKKAIIFDKSSLVEIKEICGVEKPEDIPNNREYYEFLDKKLIEDCDMAICVWNGENKRVFHMIQLLGIHNKPCYTFTLQ